MSSPYLETIQAHGTAAMSQVKTAPGKALKAALEELPVRKNNAIGHMDKKDPKTEQVYAECKLEAAKMVLTCLCSIDGPKIGGAIKELSNDEVDTLMKFIYRGFSFTEPLPGFDKFYQTLLTAHDEICKLDGTGPIIRSIHTRLEV